MQALPPYVSWNAFLRTLDSFRGAAPETVGSDSMTDLSPSLAGQMMQTFRFLGLLRADGAATPELRFLIEHIESREAVLSKVFRRSYAGLFDRASGALSEKKIEEVVARTGLSPATQRKAVTFVLNAASYLNLPVELNTAKSTQSDSSGEQASNSAERAPASARKPLTLYLASGGSVEISVNVDLLRLSKPDREFVMDLIDKVRAYRDDGERERNREARLGDEPDVVRRGDQEEAF